MAFSPNYGETPVKAGSRGSAGNGTPAHYHRNVGSPGPSKHGPNTPGARIIPKTPPSHSGGLVALADDSGGAGSPDGALHKSHTANAYPSPDRGNTFHASTAEEIEDSLPDVTRGFGGVTVSEGPSADVVGRSSGQTPSAPPSSSQDQNNSGGMSRQPTNSYTSAATTMLIPMNPHSIAQSGSPDLTPQQPSNENGDEYDDDGYDDYTDEDDFEDPTPEGSLLPHQVAHQEQLQYNGANLDGAAATATSAHSTVHRPNNTTSGRITPNTNASNSSHQQNPLGPSQSQGNTTPPPTFVEPLTTASAQPTTAACGAESNEPPPQAAPAKQRRPPAPKVRLGKKELIGSGSFGNVYRALDVDNHRIIAVKEIALMTEESRELKKQIQTLEREIRVMQKLLHDNIVKYYGASREGTRLNIYMEYVSGGTVAGWLRSYGALDTSQTSYFTFQVLRGLSYLHSKNIAHRDLKGDNLFVETTGNLKLGDFGTSKELQTVRMTNSVAGTPFFMAPEVVTCGGHGLAADIWSVGCCVIQMMTGKPPFHQYDNPYTVMFQVSKGNIEDQIPAEFPADARAFVMACCALDPASRPTASALLDHPWLAAAARRWEQQHPSDAPGAPPVSATDATGASGATCTNQPQQLQQEVDQAAVTTTTPRGQQSSVANGPTGTPPLHRQTPTQIRQQANRAGGGSPAIPPPPGSSNVIRRGGGSSQASSRSASRGSEGSADGGVARPQGSQGSSRPPLMTGGIAIKQPTPTKQQQGRGGVSNSAGMPRTNSNTSFGVTGGTKRTGHTAQTPTKNGAGGVAVAKQGSRR